jgi:hypothetical protein
VEGGLLRTAPDFDRHFEQLADAVALGGERDDRNRRFLARFVRPDGLDVPATPAFADALERLARDGPGADPSLERYAWLRPVVLPVAAWSRSGVGRWLMNDKRADAWDERAEYTERSLRARREARAARVHAKVRRRARRDRRAAFMRQTKEIKSALLKLRYRMAVAGYRALHTAGLWRGELPGSSGKD